MSQQDHDTDPLEQKIEQEIAQKDDEKPVVLIIDDDETINTMLQVAMSRNGFKSIAAYDGAEGLELAQICMPTAIILDWMMPEMDGLTVLNNLKADPKTSHIPVIMLTGKNMSEDALLAVKGGASEYIVKPFGIAEFMKRFKKNLDDIAQSK